MTHLDIFMLGYISGCLIMASFFILSDGIKLPKRLTKEQREEARSLRRSQKKALRELRRQWRLR